MAWLMNLSCVKVNSMIWISRYYVRIRGHFCSNGVVCIYTLSSSNFVRHSHLVVLHVQFNIQGEMVLSCGVVMLLTGICKCGVSSAYTWL